MSKCVFVLEILKAGVTLLHFEGAQVHEAKKVGWEVIFSELWFARYKACKPWLEFKSSTLDLFCHVVLRLNGALIV